MAKSLSNQLQTTQIWDVDTVYSTDVNTREFKELLIRLYLYINQIALAVNSKDSSSYVLNEFVNGQFFFPNPVFTSQTPTTPNPRPAYRVTVNFGALPNTGAKSVNHNTTITTGFTATRVYGAAFDPVALTMIPIPFADPTATSNNISLVVNATNVTVTTGSNRSNFTRCIIVFEYLKN